MIRLLTTEDAASAAEIARASMPQPWSEEAFAKEAANSAFLLLGAFADAGSAKGGQDAENAEYVPDAGSADGLPTADTSGSAVRECVGALLGFITLALTPDDAELIGIAVDAAFRRRGIAGALLQAARTRLREQYGLRRMVLEVRLGNRAAIAFYEKYGFTCIGVRRNFYEDPREDALVMTDQKERNDD